MVVCVVIRVPQGGAMTYSTILDLLRTDLATPRAEHAVHHRPGHARVLSTAEFLARTVAVARALADLGVSRGDRVLVVSDNRPEWHMVDLALLAQGATNVPLYTTLTPAQIAYQATDSGAAVGIAEGPELMSRLAEARRECPALRHLIQIEGEPLEDTLSLDELTTKVEPGGDAWFWERAASVEPDDLATIVYTSGTTGEPKGVMLSHHNIVTNVREILERVDIGEPGDLGLEFLPLCHMIERIAGYCYMARATNRAYCSVHHVAELIPTVRPTIFASVPRVLEKVHDGIMQRVAAAPPRRRAIFHWALRAGLDAARHRLDGTRPPFALRARHALADRLVLGKVRAALGGRLRGTFCGGAPLPLHVHEFFQALGMPIQEAYGLTETSPVLTLNGYQPGTCKLGSVGRALPSCELKVAEDGELLARGPNITRGYWNKPERTAEAFDADGFFHTGDVVRIDDEGFVFITDRKKDLIVTAGGKNIAPQPIESLLKQSPYVDTAVLIGDRRPFVVALLSPNPESVLAWAAQHGLGHLDLAELVARPELVALFGAAVEEANRDLARFEQVKRFRILPSALSIDGGELTPTLKVRRALVTRQYADLIEGMYAADS